VFLLRPPVIERRDTRTRIKSAISDRVSDHGHSALAPKQKSEGKGAVEAEGRSDRQRTRQWLREFFFLDDRVLAATFFYFPTAAMEGDIDNIVKPILDGMITIIYPNDWLLERITVQKFEPGIVSVFRSLTPTLEQATETDPPVLYIRIDDDLSWREVT